MASLTAPSASPALAVKGNVAYIEADIDSSKHVWVGDDNRTWAFVADRIESTDHIFIVYFEHATFKVALGVKRFLENVRRQPELLPSFQDAPSKHILIEFGLDDGFPNYFLYSADSAFPNVLANFYVIFPKHVGRESLLDCLAILRDEVLVREVSSEAKELLQDAITRELMR
jgi:hypothetical protein